MTSFGINPENPRILTNRGPVKNDKPTDDAPAAPAKKTSTDEAGNQYLAGMIASAPGINPSKISLVSSTPVWESPGFVSETKQMAAQVPMTAILGETIKNAISTVYGNTSEADSLSAAVNSQLNTSII
ncbi:MAG: hypothetical protein DKM50_10290 [Candidatus Margulisiibacteriota bacterium]|nr:MAG: hypothetical protein A2X43_06325 [Candidatus Margulisbacteria bacterium GWD2_39_127]OGI05234.1 MAG: hypothetical protein A2X42_02885 [Candidatus Margulisbacteria bacterium GWF2_38_17]OGI06283.1 MAG: hypothetical protein A2X41_08465 [Candidatus Margulisbacteria bacterium GWE2_39_32]PZM78940.1 MAG: hypothetical protein DKM50_10290 [Candidatus Margulisiibacteriota bacterium]HAR64322.1 hypothetical protein [Candidatus Margulisiibacteriota bacterium]